MRKVLVALVVAVLVAATPAPAAWGAPCVAEGGDEADAPTATFVLLPGQGTSLHFGARRAERNLELEFEVEGCEFPGGSEIVGNHGVFSSEQAEFPAAQIVVSGTAGRTLATLNVRVNPTGVPAGTYTGALRIDDPRGHTYRIPMVTLTLKRDLPTPLLLLGLGALLVAGSWIVWLKGKVAGGKEGFFWDWWRKGGNLIAVGIGLVAAWAAWKAGYSEDRDWGADMLTDGVTLAGVVFGGYIAAATTASIGGDAVRGGPDKREEEARPPL